MEAAPATEAFEPIRELGRGGMGVVYLVRDLRQGDVCAATLLHEHLSRDETVVARFQAEARRASEIRHPAICQVRGAAAPLACGAGAG